jgi:nucleoside-diphosphate-sugar epimerase
MISQNSLYITGASGWLANNAIMAFESIYENPRITRAFSSSVHNKVKNPKIDVILDSYKTFSELRSESVDIFIPAAFLTQDKLLTVSESQYSTLNRKLIREARDFILNNDTKSVINLSSGVVTQLSNRQRINRNYLIYRDLKREQEDVLSEACDRTGSQFVNCRIFSLTGTHNPQPNKYAFFNLISQAISGEITLYSGHEVVRKYMDSKELFQLLLLACRNGKNIEFESSGSIINLETLSLRIFNILDRHGVINNIKNPEIETDYYYALKHNFKISNIEKQILNGISDLLQVKRM